MNYPLWKNLVVLQWLWALPLVIWLVIFAERRRRRSTRRFASETMVPRLMSRRTDARLALRCSLLALGLGMLIIALARPRFGEKYAEVTTRGLDVFVLLDVSRSMDATDVAPSRLEVAKSDIKDLLLRLKGDRVGLIAFAGAAVVKVPLTDDLPFFRSVLSDLDTASAPRGGSLIGDAIRQALQAMKPAGKRDQALILITDGEDHDSFPREAAKAAAKRDVKIFTVGLGDAREGMRIPVRGKDGSAGYLQHEGQEIWSKLDEQLLRDIALETAGAYIPAGTKTYDLGEFYEQQLSELTRADYRSAKRRRYLEQYQWFLCAGLLLLLGEWLTSTVRPTTENDFVDNSPRGAAAKTAT